MLILAFSSRVYVETKYDIMVWLFGVRYYVSMITLDVKGPYATIKNTFMREEVFKTVTFFSGTPCTRWHFYVGGMQQSQCLTPIVFMLCQFINVDYFFRVNICI